jgi:hypothetical protein
MPETGEKMNVEFHLENWCEKNGINPEKIDNKLWEEVVGRIEDEIDDFIREKMPEFLQGWTYMIEQELSEHPEWKNSCQKQRGEGK